MSVISRTRTTGVYVVYDGAWYEFGGTSVGAPQWSALIALANQGRSSGNLSGVDDVIYSIANGGNHKINPTYFHDVTSGAMAALRTIRLVSGTTW